MLRSSLRPLRTALACGAAFSLVLAACGGDDGAAPARPGDVPAGAQDALDALEEMGIDLDDLASLGDLEGLDLDDFDPENFDPTELEAQLDDLTEGFDELISSFGGDGGGTVTVDGVTYTVDADVCLAFDEELTIDGPAVGSDGSVAWVSANYGITRRADMVDFVDESMLEFMFPDGVDELIDFSIEVNVGQTSRFESIDDQPQWNAYSGDLFGTAELDYQVSGGAARGSGQAEDYNGVGAMFGETVPIEFELACD